MGTADSIHDDQNTVSYLNTQLHFYELSIDQAQTSSGNISEEMILTQKYHCTYRRKLAACLLQLSLQGIT
jgi:hypothetical protein